MAKNPGQNDWSEKCLSYYLSATPQTLNKFFSDFDKLYLLEIKDMQKKKKQLKEQYKLEDSIASTSAIWSTEILPNWAAMWAALIVPWFIDAHRYVERDVIPIRQTLVKKAFK